MQKKVRATPPAAFSRGTWKRKKPATAKAIGVSRTAIQRGFHQRGFESLVLTLYIDVKIIVSILRYKNIVEKYETFLFWK